MRREGPCHTVQTSQSNPMVHRRQVLWPGSANTQEAETVGSPTGYFL